MPDAGPLQGKTILVTGATGFIGGRLVEKLVLEEGALVRALVRNYAHAARLARFDVGMVGGSLQDADAVDRVVEGVDIVFNLAYVTSDSADENVAAIGNVIDACLHHRVQRLVQISTVAVHEPFPNGEIGAETPVGPGPNGYSAAKIAIEQEVFRAVEKRGLDAVILRPSIVYGPFGGSWTDQQVTNLIEDRVVLPDAGEGLCNGVFVDDLVDAMILAAIKSEARGEDFLISGPDTVTWKTFYESLEKCIGIKTVQYQPSSARPAPEAPAGPVSKSGGGRMRSPARRQVSRLASGMSKDQKRRLRRFLRRYLKLGSQPPRASIDLEFFAARPICRIDKARAILGYDPKFDFDAGMAVTCEYLRWAYPLDIR
jgi:nucleoside-diphosphate-sugar epimerase